MGVVSGTTPIKPTPVASFQLPPSPGAKIDVVLGAQWGDEGKGKLVDILSQVSRLSHFFYLSCTAPAF
jgi:hypothetical protein